MAHRMLPVIIDALRNEFKGTTIEFIRGPAANIAVVQKETTVVGTLTEQGAIVTVGQRNGPAREFDLSAEKPQDVIDYIRDLVHRAN
jgi:hypothetical protein